MVNNATTSYTCSMVCTLDTWGRDIHPFSVPVYYVPVTLLLRITRGKSNLTVSESSGCRRKSFVGPLLVIAV
jgi:hypothetical protein